MCVCLDKIKDQVVAKIAMQAADLYADALTNMQVGSIKSMWDKVCVCVCVYSGCYYVCLFVFVSVFVMSV